MTTICFDTTVHPCPTNELKLEVYDHGGGGTNIYKGFRHLEE